MAWLKGEASTKNSIFGIVKVGEFGSKEGQGTMFHYDMKGISVVGGLFGLSS